jgi:hypothetical protein
MPAASANPRPIDANTIARIGHGARRRRTDDTATVRSEETLLAEIQRRLLDEFPHVGPAAVNTLIREEHARFEASQIRDFVPLFVEKRARGELKRKIVNAPDVPGSKITSG